MLTLKDMAKTAILSNARDIDYTGIGEMFDQLSMEEIEEVYECVMQANIKVDWDD